MKYTIIYNFTREKFYTENLKDRWSNYHITSFGDVKHAEITLDVLRTKRFKGENMDIVTIAIFNFT